MSQVPPRTRLRALLCLCAILTIAPAAVGQAPDSSLVFDVNGPTQRLEMIVNTSRILTLDKKIPRLQVNNPDVVSAQPLSPFKVQLAALRPGDIFNKHNKHVRLFVEWVDAARTRAKFYEAGPKVALNEHSIPKMLEEGYSAWRYRGIED